MNTAVVTGAGRGIGREIARRLARRGYAVLCTDVDETAARSTAEEIGEPAWGMALDVREPDAHRRAATAAAERGPLKVWVNNAGVLRTEKAWAHSDDEVRLLIEANLLGVIWGSRAAVDNMSRNGSDAHILNIASMSSFGPAPGLGTYGATKHAVLGYTTSLQGDLAAAGIPIRTHAFCPDTVETGLVHEQERKPDAVLLFSAPRMLDVDEVADRAVALIDSKAMIASVPRYRAALMRVIGSFPRVGLALLPVFRRLAERERAKR